MNKKYEDTYLGKKLDECSREELIECVKHLSDYRVEYYANKESNRNKELMQENKILREIIGLQGKKG